MDSKIVAAALEEVQNAYKIVYDFSNVLQDIYRCFYTEFKGYRNYQQRVSKHAPDGYLCGTPTNNLAVLYTRRTDETFWLCLQKGDALVSCEVAINESLYPHVESNVIRKPFIYAAVMAATDDVPSEALENEGSNNWYHKIWNTTSYSDHGTSMKHPQKPWIKIYTEIIQLESMYDAASIKAVAAGFKARAEKELGVTL